MDIIIEILSRLPVKSLLRCKSVCKSWCSLVSDPYFIKYHLASSTTNHHYAHHRLLVGGHVPVTNLKICSLYDVLYDGSHINPLEVDYPMKHPHKLVSIVGSCNGLICIAIEPHNLFIWNPSTRKSIQLPDYPRSRGNVMHGFAYKESSDDYKVVEITECDDSYRNIVMIYSSKNGKWKEIGDFPHYTDWHDSDVFLNGALHWLASKDNGSRIIVSLDLAKETYGELLLPFDKEIGSCSRLGISGDCLWVMYEYNKSCRFIADVWVMKVYGVKDSWFELFSIPYHVTPVFIKCNWAELAPLCVSDDEKVLLQFGSRLIVFDSKDDSALVIRKFYGCNEACTFVESLVSPAHTRIG